VEPFIRIEGVSQVFEARRGTALRALSDISLDVQENEFVTLVRRSGCGKSTLLRVIAGLLPPTAGEVRLPDRDQHGDRADGDAAGAP